MLRLLTIAAALPLALLADAPLTATSPADTAARAALRDSVQIREWTVPWENSRPRDPYFDATTGDVWFTVQGGNLVGNLKKATGEVRLIRVPTPRARPYGIVLDSKGRPWFNEFGSHRIAMVEPSTTTLREFTLPDTAARGRRIAITPDDMVWYVDYARGYLGRLNPETAAVDEWAMPGGARSRPYAMMVDDRGRLWAVETGVSPNRFVGFDPVAGRFTSVTPVPSSTVRGGNTVRHMMFNPTTREIWFGTDANTIGRAAIP